MACADGRPTPDQLAMIAEKHGFDRSDIQPMPSAGVVNAVYAVGDAIVLRVPTGVHPDAVADTLTESVAVPAARTAGIRTPALLIFDNSRDIVEFPITVYERALGRDLGARGDVDGPIVDRIYREVGRELATLHRDVIEVPDPDGYLDSYGRRTDLEFVEDLLLRGRLNRTDAAVMSSLFERVRPALERAETMRRFLHQDVTPGNLMGKGDRFTAIIDWGDAGWGDPVQDFRYLPRAAVGAALAGYREIMPLDDDETAAARILWDQLCDVVEEATDGSEDPAQPLHLDSVARSFGFDSV
jgi:Ser/Thr protein kinase RdoA (MazF antagonist)